MATTYRRRHNAVYGTLGASLSAGATSVTFAAALKEGGPSGTSIATLGTDEYLPLTIDDEVVYLTAYTSGATSGTISRGKEGTVDASHANGASFVNGPTKRDTARFRFTQFVPASDLSTSSISWADIDSTNLPALALTLDVGDVVELSFEAGMSMTASGNVGKIDWLIDRPTSADTTIRNDSTTFGAGMFETGTNQTDLIDRQRVTALFVCTEAGVHTFKPQWRVGGGTFKIRGGDANYQTAVLHMVRNLGQQAA